MFRVAALIILTLVVMGRPVWAEEMIDSEFKKEVQDTVYDAVNASKDFFSGVIDGFTSGGEGANYGPEWTVANKKDLARLLSVTVTSAKDLGEGRWQVVAALHNHFDEPVLVTNLAGLGNVVLIDAAGFSHALPDAQAQGKDVVCLARSATRLQLTFNNLDAPPETLRIFNTDFGVPVR